MIYTREEIEFLNRMMLAKSRRIAEVTVDWNLSETRRNEAVEALTSEVNVIRAMISIGRDRIDELAENDQGALREAAAGIAREEGSGEGDAQSEARLNGLVSRLSMQVDLVFRAAALAEIPGCGLDDTDEGTMLRLRAIAAELSNDAEIRGMNFWTDLGPALARLDEQCSVLLRIRSLSPISNEEISEAARTLLDSVTGHGDWILTAILPEPQLDILRRFRLRSPRYVSMMYARCILNARNPELEKTRSPGRRRWPTRTSWRSSGSPGSASTS